jgi:hypothetical protein
MNIYRFSILFRRIELLETFCYHEPNLRGALIYRGDTRIHVDTLIRITKALDCPASSIIFHIIYY